jgi:hypothetical protein
LQEQTIIGSPLAEISALSGISLTDIASVRSENARSGNCAPSQTDYVAVTEIVLCNVLGLIPPSPRLLTIGQLM